MKKIFGVITALLLTLGGYSKETLNTSFSRDNFLAEFVSRTWTAANGLPGNAITDIIQDSTGYLYLGTYDGLVRFDGVEFVTFNKNYDPKYDFVSSRTVFEDSKGNIWNGSNDEGLFCISPDGNVKVYNTENGLPSNSIRAITEDKEGNIWAGTSSGAGYVDSNGNFIVPSGLEKFGAGLADKPRIVLCNKIDVEGAAEHAEEVIEMLHKKDPSIQALAVSVMAKTNMDEARKVIIDLVERMDRLHRPGENHSTAESKPEKSAFMASRSVDDSMEEQFPGM